MMQTVLTGHGRSAAERRQNDKGGLHYVLQ